MGSSRAVMPLLLSRRDIHFCGGHRPIREHRHNVARDLDEASVQIIPSDFVADLDAHFPEAKPPDQGARPGANPISPSYSGSTTKSAFVSKAVSSGVTTMQVNCAIAVVTHHTR